MILLVNTAYFVLLCDRRVTLQEQLIFRFILHEKKNYKEIK